MTAHQLVMDGMQACLPEHCPLPFTAIESVTGVQKQGVVAHVVMFDGQLGTLSVSRVFYGDTCSGWCIHWQDLPGGAIHWNALILARKWRFVNVPR